MQVRGLAVVFALWVNAAAAQEQVLCGEHPLVSRVDCEQSWALNRALTKKDRNTEVIAAYSLLRLTLAKHYDAGELSKETYTKLDNVALEMFMSAVAVRQGYLRGTGTDDDALRLRRDDQHEPGAILRGHVGPRREDGGGWLTPTRP
jgi:hypothetical protein